MLFPWGVKRPGCEADHSPPSSSEVKESVELYLHTPHTSSWCGAYLSTGTTLPLPLPLTLPLLLRLSLTILLPLHLIPFTFNL